MAEEQKTSSNILSKIKNTFTREEIPFTAESCFIQSKYGAGSFKPLVERIRDKQNHIKSTIRSKFAPPSNINLPNYSSYHAVIDIEEDLINFTEEIFKPFIESGFNVVDLSKECKSVVDDGIYLISWKMAFQNK